MPNLVTHFIIFVWRRYINILLSNDNGVGILKKKQKKTKNTYYEIIYYNVLWFRLNFTPKIIVIRLM